MSKDYLLFNGKTENGFVSLLWLALVAPQAMEHPLPYILSMVYLLIAMFTYD